ncbi:iron complex transport system substrate-binding protein [Methylobacillus rhizosphaerae]|uniref:Iron complex transport system substrate-binding protein n=1 Tax=Methylobacillus rhizosphaerae TaxID=551994 RepID=A0A238YL52_9PROT|nr:ABC transporter substrate-binding protein [Methylobacillus rhizosphaerae]SNR71895.1 iron complex transport system substrate-binding protein [Methylobacillus rhizosphaerae]
MKIHTLLLSIGLVVSSLAAHADEKLLTIGGSVTEIVYALGKGDLVIANDITSNYPEAAANKPKIGYMRTLSAEGLISTGATLVIAEAGAGPRNVLEQVNRAGLKVLQLQDNTHTPQQIAADIRIIGKQLNAESTEQVARDFEHAWQAADAKLNSLPDRPRVLFVMNNAGRGAQVAGDETAAAAVIKLARADNVMANQYKDYRPLTAEALVAAAPDVIITTSEGLEASGGLQNFLKTPGISMTPAGKNQRIISMDTQYLLGFTPRLPAAAMELGQAIRK